MLTNGTAQARMEKAQIAFRNPNLHQFLKWKYHNEPIFERVGQTYPVAVYPAPTSQIRFPDSVLLGLEDAPDQEVAVQDSSFRQLRKQLGAVLKNDPTFTMKELIIDQNQSGQTTQVGLKCGLGTYFEALDTCDALEWEILSKFTDLTGSTAAAFEQFDRQLPLRSALHAKVANPVRDGRHRSAAIAISTLVAYYNEMRDLTLWLQLRSATTTAVHSNLIHVIPSFMFQPTTVYLKEEFSVRHNIYREYLEEIFDRRELRKRSTGHWRYFYGDPCLRYLRRLLYTQEAELYLSGVAVNLLNLRPEICTVLFIRSSKWYGYHSQGSKISEEHFHLNLEWEKGLRYTGREKPLVAEVSYRAKDEEFVEKDPLYPGNMVPPGAAAFWLGLDVLRGILSESPRRARTHSIPCMVFRNPGVMAFSEGVGSI